MGGKLWIMYEKRTVDKIRKVLLIQNSNLVKNIKVEVTVRTIISWNYLKWERISLKVPTLIKKCGEKVSKIVKCTPRSNNKIAIRQARPL